MAILHQATLTPTKAEVVAGWLQSKGESADSLAMIGGYRFDDPAGEVGVEGLLFETGTGVCHLLLTYRPAPLPGVTELSTMQHSALGKRWVYAGENDPVALECVSRALAGAQEQAVMEVYNSEHQLVEIRQPLVEVRVLGPAPVAADRVELLTRPISHHQGPALIAAWSGGEGVVAVAH